MYYNYLNFISSEIGQIQVYHYWITDQHHIYDNKYFGNTENFLPK